MDSSNIRNPPVFRSAFVFPFLLNYHALVFCSVPLCFIVFRSVGDLLGFRSLIELYLGFRSVAEFYLVFRSVIELYSFALLLSFTLSLCY